MHVLPYYRQISRDRKFDQPDAAPDLPGTRHYKILSQFEAENANFICFNLTCKYGTDSAKSKIW